MTSGIELQLNKQQGEIIGCGAFIPGAGPGNFPDFDFGPPIDSGGGDDGIITDPVDPPDPIDPGRPDTEGPAPSTSGIAPGGATPFTPGGAGPGPITPGTGGPAPGPPTPPTGPPTGPTTPGTGGPIGPPTTPPTAPSCKCVLVNANPPVFPGTGDALVQTWNITYEFTCSETTGNPQTDLQNAIDGALQGLQDSSPSFPNFNVVWEVSQGTVGTGADPGGDCSEGGSSEDGAVILPTTCTGDCKDVQVTITRTKIPIPQDEPDVADPIDGGGFVGPETPTPVNPEVEDEDPVQPPVDDGGNVDPGGSFGAPFDDSGLADVQTGLARFELENGVINLNNPDLKAFLENQGGDSIGSQDGEIAFSIKPNNSTQVANSVDTELFAPFIDSNVNYFLNYKATVGDWDSTRALGVTPDTVYNSLSVEAKNILSGIKQFNGNPLNKEQIYTLIGSRILDGTISNVSLTYLKSLRDNAAANTITQIIPSTSKTVNEVVAQALINRHAYNLDPSSSQGVGRNALPNYQTFATDVDRHIRVNVGGETRRLYTRDNRTVASSLTIPVRDGNYIDVSTPSRQSRLYLGDEVSHAFTLPENVKDQVVSLLGGTPERVLEVSAPITSGIEYDYSLSTSRESFYVLSCNIDSVDTIASPTGSFLLKDTTAKFELVDISNNLDEFNDYIKYKLNRRLFVLDDEDLIFDYVAQTSSLNYTQTDVISDSGKENSTVKLLTREVPYYIVLIPTNRPDLNIFNSKSQITDVTDNNVVVRQLRCRRNISPKFNQSGYTGVVNLQTSAQDAINVYGQVDKDTRVTQFNPDDALFQEMYQDSNGNLMAASAYTPSRKKTGFRLINEITADLSANYILERNGLGEILTEFDVYSRMSLREFTRLIRLENYTLLLPLIQKGFFNGIRVVPPLARSSPDVVAGKTSLIRRRTDANASDAFTQQKSTNNRRTLIPPTTTEPGRLG